MTTTGTEATEAEGRTFYGVFLQGTPIGIHVHPFTAINEANERAIPRTESYPEKKTRVAALEIKYWFDSPPEELPMKEVESVDKPWWHETESPDTAAAQLAFPFFSEDEILMESLDEFSDDEITVERCIPCCHGFPCDDQWKGK